MYQVITIVDGKERIDRRPNLNTAKGWRTQIFNKMPSLCRYRVMIKDPQGNVVADQTRYIALGAKS